MKKKLGIIFILIAFALSIGVNCSFANTTDISTEEKTDVNSNTTSSGGGGGGGGAWTNPNKVIPEGIKAEITVYNSNGNELNGPEDITAGYYNVIVTAKNHDDVDKEVYVYLAVKALDRVVGVYQNNNPSKIEEANSTKSAIAKFYNVYVPEGYASDEIEISAYFWNEGMAPLSNKCFFGEKELFYVKGWITDTDRSDSTLEPTQVRFGVLESDNFNGYKYGKDYLDPTYEMMQYYSNEKYSQFLKLVNAVISKEEHYDDTGRYLYREVNYTIESIDVIDDGITVNASDFVSYTLSYSSTYVNSLSFYDVNSKDSTNTFELASNAEFYVNGTHIADNYYHYSREFIESINNYIENNPGATITLVDFEDYYLGKDGKFDFVLVDYYEDAIVDKVNDYINYGQISWKYASSNISSFRVGHYDNDKYIYMKNEQVIDYTDIKENDILSIAYDVRYDFKNSDYYIIQVSDDRVSGTVSAITQYNNEYYYTVDGKKYKASRSLYGAESDFQNGTLLTVGSSYTLSLNCFGEIANFTEDKTGVLFGIVNGAYVNALDEPIISIITTDGTIVDYLVEDKSKELFSEFACEFFNDVKTEANTNCSEKKPFRRMIVEYTVNQAGYITSVDLTDMAEHFTTMYNDRVNTLGTHTLYDNSSIVNLTDGLNDVFEQVFNKVSIIKNDDLINYARYSGYIINVISSTGVHNYVFIQTIEGPQPYQEMIGVCVDFDGSYDADLMTWVDEIKFYSKEYDDIKSIEISPYCDITKDVYKSGERGNVKTIEKDSYLEYGTVFTYRIDDDGKLTDIKVLFSFDEDDFTDEILCRKQVASCFNEPLFTDNLFPLNSWLNTTYSSSAGKIGMVFGPIMDKFGSSITVARPTTDGIVDMEYGVEDLSVASDANIYVYDFYEDYPNYVSRGSMGSIVKTNVPIMYRNGNKYQLGNQNEFPVNFIVAKTVDDEITDALVIVGAYLGEDE